HARPPRALEHGVALGREIGKIEMTMAVDEHDARSRELTFTTRRGALRRQYHAPMTEWSGAVPGIGRWRARKAHSLVPTVPPRAHRLFPHGLARGCAAKSPARGTLRNGSAHRRCAPRGRPGSGSRRDRARHVDRAAPPHRARAAGPLHRTAEALGRASLPRGARAPHGLAHAYREANAAAPRSAPLPPAASNPAAA